MPLSVALGGDGKTLVSGSMDGTVKVWDVSTGPDRIARKGPTNLVATVALSGDGKTIVSGSGVCAIKVWDVDTGLEHATLQGRIGPVLSGALSGDGKTVALGSYDGTIKVWDVATGLERATLKHHKDAIRSVSLKRRRQDACFGKCGRDDGGLARGYGMGYRLRGGKVRPGPFLSCLWR